MDTENQPQTTTLELWLPGYHTPSLNVTKGHHWSKYHALKKEAARVLLSAIDALPAHLWTPRISRAQQRLSRICSGLSLTGTSPTTPPSSSTSTTRKRASGQGMKKGRG